MILAFAAGCTAASVLAPSSVQASVPHPVAAEARSKPSPASAPRAEASPRAQTPASPPIQAIVLKMSYYGTTTSPSFTTGPVWSLAYSFDCASLGKPGTFAIADEYGTTLLSTQSASDKATVYIHDDAGRHALEVYSQCYWTVTATDGDSGS